MITRYRLTLILVLMATAWALPVQAQACSADEVPATVKNLGHWENGYDYDIPLGCLSEHGEQAAGLLLNELRPMPEGVIGLEEQGQHADSMHVIWCIRALRYITGLDFKAGSAAALRKMKLAGGARDLLLIGSGDEVLVFSVAMSHDTTYIAPEDVQKAVFEKWKAWYASQGKGFKYSAHTHLDDWYF